MIASHRFMQGFPLTTITRPVVRVRSSPLRSSGSILRVRAAASNEGQEFGLAPAKPKTPYGEMLQYYLKMQPQLFKAAVEQQLQLLKEEKDAKGAAAASSAAPASDQPVTPHPELDDEQLPPPSPGDMVLLKRMEEVRAREVRATLEDLMYVSILEKFIILGVEMLPRLDGFVDPGPANLVALTEGVHSKEALELVREHLLGVMGPAAGRQFSSELIKMSKFQIAQVYAASVMFGYFLRRVDRRFQLEKALGSIDSDGSPSIGPGAAAAIAEALPPAGGGAADDAVARLERLFQEARDVEAASDPDSVEGTVYEVSTGDDADSSAAEAAAAARRASSSTGPSGTAASAGEAAAAASAAAAATGGGSLLPRKSSLRRYVEGFDQATMVETARVVSAEGAALVERQTAALFGDIKDLTKQMQEAVGGGVGSAEELYSRIQAAIADNKIETVTMTVATQRRCVLEAVAFGSFLRDVEGHVQSDYGLLTPLRLEGPRGQ